MPQPSSLFYAVEALEVGDGELEIGLALELVPVEREGEVDAGAVLFEELRRARRRARRSRGTAGPPG